MYRTLSELRDTINQLIESQGENAGCAAFVFTQNDVFEYNEEMTQEEHFPTLFTEVAGFGLERGSCSFLRAE